MKRRLRPGRASQRLWAAAAVAAVLAPPQALAGDRVAHSGPDGLTIVDVEGGDPTVVAAAGDHPAWSPDGELLAFTDQEGVWVVAVAGGAPRLLHRDVRAQHVAWSPDGALLVYDRGPVGDSGLVILSLDGSAAPTELLNPQGASLAEDPAWSPDGGAIVYRLFDLSTGYYDLVVQPTPPGFPATLRPATVVVDQKDISPHFSAPAWSPDGVSIIFSAVTRTGPSPANGDIYTVRRDGSGLSLVLRSVDWGEGWPGEDWLAQDPAFSPDGGAIAYALTYSAGDQNQPEEQRHAGIWVRHLAKRDDRRIASTPATDHVPAWTADGRRVVFEGETNDSGCHCDILDLLSVRADGSDMKTLSEFAIRDSATVSRPAPSPGAVWQLPGATRIETALSVSRAAFDAAGTVVVARADAYPDALAGGPLAASLDAPLLLVPRDSLPGHVAQEIRRLGAAQAVVLGSTAAIADSVVAQLRAAGVADVDRIGGADRFDTARLIAERLPAAEAFIVEGGHADPARGWPDAIAVGALAGHLEQPILLAIRDQLPAATSRALSDGDFSAVRIIGGQSAVSADVAGALEALDLDVRRTGGATRYDTSAQVAQLAAASGLDAARPWLATGRNWPDSLAAGPAAAHSGGVVLLVDGMGLSGSPEARAFIEANAPSEARIAGGVDVVVPGVHAAVERLAR